MARDTRFTYRIVLLAAPLLWFGCTTAHAAAPVDPSTNPADRPPAVIDVLEVIPDAALDIRYATVHNFVGASIHGYEAPKCLLTRQAAVALKTVQEQLQPLGLSLKFYDCYRPVRAVTHFVQWAKDLADTKTKTEFYPNVDKADLFKLGYIAEKSSHNRASTVDVTIVPIPASPQPPFSLGSPQVSCTAPVTDRFADNSLDMGTGYDCFHNLSHTNSLDVAPQSRANRALLKTLMENAGFKSLAEEWWHYTLHNEPFPETYFDFVVR